MEKVVIIIPTYNESECIRDTINTLQTVFKKIPHYDMHLLIFDSHSTDQTIRVVNDIMANASNITLLTEKKKSGLGSAYIQAMQFAIKEMEADIVFEYDADGSHQPKYLINMMSLFEKGADVVIGSRYIHGGSIPKDWSVDRKILSVLGNWVARFFLTFKFRDFTSGFRGTRTKFLKKINLNKLLSKNYAYKLHLFWELYQLGANIIEYPIEFIERKKGYSKFPKNNLLESLKIVIILRLRKLKRYLSICIVGIFGMIAQIISYNILRHFLIPEYANMVSVELAIITNFFVNNRFTFSERRLRKHDKKKTWLSKLLQFNLFSLGSMLLQTLILIVGINLFGKGAILENIFVLCGIFLGSIYNFTMYSHVIWKKQKDIPTTLS